MNRGDEMESHSESHSISKKECKLAAARAALEVVENGMNLGVGTGSTVDIFIDLLAKRIRNLNLQLTLVATSYRTEKRLQKEGLQPTDLNELQCLNLTIDGTDEINPQFHLIKGGGGALLREKIVADSSEQMAVIADESKFVKTLGKHVIPVEVDQFGWNSTRVRINTILNKIGETGDDIKLRASNGKPFTTDGGNFILDARINYDFNPEELDRQLSQVPGIVETGLFINQCSMAYIGNYDGTVDKLVRRSFVPNRNITTS